MFGETELIEQLLFVELVLVLVLILSTGGQLQLTCLMMSS
jgi:hypothetical protein